MSYPTKVHIRHSTVLVIVLLLMGSVLYEVTRTESAPRQNAARTQDISLPAVQPARIAHLAIRTRDYVGTSSMSAASVKGPAADPELILTAPLAGVAAPAALRTEASAARPAAPGSFGRSVAARVRSSDGAGFAAGGTSGVGAWGGVSGVMRPEAAAASTTARAARPARQTAARTSSPRRSSGSSGGASPELLAAPVVFTTGAAAVESGAVAALQPSEHESPGSAPAPTPEPMSLLLVGTGLAAIYNVRRHLQ